MAALIPAVGRGGRFEGRTGVLGPGTSFSSSIRIGFDQCSDSNVCKCSIVTKIENVTIMYQTGNPPQSI